MRKQQAKAAVRRASVVRALVILLLSAILLRGLDAAVRGAWAASVAAAGQDTAVACPAEKEADGRAAPQVV